MLRFLYYSCYRRNDKNRVSFKKISSFRAHTENINQAEKLFNSSEIDIVKGHRVLGSVIGSETSCNEYKRQKQNEYIGVVEKLSKHAKTSPQNAYHCFAKGLQNKLTFLSRTTPAILENLQETEKLIKNKLIPALTGKQEVSEDDRLLFSLPVRDGGLNISPTRRPTARNQLVQRNVVMFRK